MYTWKLSAIVPNMIYFKPVILKFKAFIYPLKCRLIFNDTFLRNLYFCLIKKKCVNVSIWILFKFTQDIFQNKLYIVGCWLGLSFVVKCTRNKSHRAWSLPVRDTGATFKELMNYFLVHHRYCKSRYFFKININNNNCLYLKSYIFKPLKLSKILTIFLRPEFFFFIKH